MFEPLRKFNQRVFEHQGILVLTLVIFSVVVLFYDLGARSFWEPDEGRYAEISREMVESGDWLTPRLNYIKHFDKPPLVYWLIGSSFKLFGQNEFAGHLPLVLLGIGAVLITFALGKRLFGRRCGFLAGCILISYLGYPAGARILSTDIIFSFFCFLCYLFFIQERYLLFYLAMALGFMTKGPVVFVITLIPICIFLIYARKIPIFKQMRWGRGLLLFALVALPWYIYEAVLNKGLLSNWLIGHTLHRIVRNRTQPFYFFLPVSIGTFFPWIFFFIPAIKRYLTFKRPRLNEQSQHILLLFLWVSLPFIFFSCIGKKLVPYILPLSCPLAIITARLWDELMGQPRLIATRGVAAAYYILLTCLVSLTAAIIAFVSLGFAEQFGIRAAQPNIMAIVLILAGTILVSFVFFRTGKAAQLFATLVLGSAFFFLAVIDLLPKIETTTGKSVKQLTLKIKENLRPEDQVANYRCFLNSLPFYLGRRTIVVERQRNLAYGEDLQEAQRYLLDGKEDLYRLLDRKDLRVFCITYSWEFSQIKQEYARPLYLLGQAGKYVLFQTK